MHVPDDVLRDRVMNTLQRMIDPESMLSISEMRVISEIRVEAGRVRIIYTPPANLCPVGINLAFHIRREVNRIEGVQKVEMRVRGGIHGALRLDHE